MARTRGEILREYSRGQRQQKALDMQTLMALANLMRREEEMQLRREQMEATRGREERAGGGKAMAFAVDTLQRLGERVGPDGQPMPPTAAELSAVEQSIKAMGDAEGASPAAIEAAIGYVRRLHPERERAVLRTGPEGEKPTPEQTGAATVGAMQKGLLRPQEAHRRLRKQEGKAHEKAKETSAFRDKLLAGSASEAILDLLGRTRPQGTTITPDPSVGRMPETALPDVAEGEEWWWPLPKPGILDMIGSIFSGR